VKDYRLGSVTVACEGYDYPDDPYVLAGSCGLEYSLELTEQGRNKRSGQYQTGGSSSYSNYYSKGDRSSVRFFFSRRHRFIFV
jgi:hypothetical protein